MLLDEFYTLSWKRKNHGNQGPPPIFRKSLGFFAFDLHLQMSSFFFWPLFTSGETIQINKSEV